MKKIVDVKDDKKLMKRTAKYIPAQTNNSLGTCKAIDIQLICWHM